MMGAMKVCKLSVKDGERLAQRAKSVPSLRRREALVHGDAASGYVATLRTVEALAGRDRVRAEGAELGADRLRQARARLFFGWAAAMSDPLPDSVMDETTLLLDANPELQLEYMGRGRFQNESHLPTKKNELLALDHALGKRTYLFRRINAPVGELDERGKHVRDQFERFRTWFNEPGVRLVISVGGGAMRMFAATAVLRAIDHLLDHDRSKVHEVWGSSGGAFLGYVFSNGFDMRVVDEIGFDVYNGRAKQLINPSFSSLARYTAANAVARARGKRPPHPFEAWADALDVKEPPSTRKHPKLAYFAMATNTRSAEPIALGEEQFIPASCRDILVACAGRDAMCASTSVPFLIPPHRGITGTADDTWVDGSITDENPLALPFAKWLRERQTDPEHTPSRLKILSVHLNLRMSESAVMNRIVALPLFRRTRLIKHAGRLLDMSLDSKTYAPLKILASVPGVEVLTLKLSLGWLGANSVRDIPAAMRAGRSLEAWKILLYANGKQQLFQAPNAVVGLPDR
jgi:hypothetical protein